VNTAVRGVGDSATMLRGSRSLTLHLLLQLSRMFTARIKLGLLDPPGAVSYNTIPYDLHRRVGCGCNMRHLLVHDFRLLRYSVVASLKHTTLARTVAEAGIVLITNRASTLPLLSSNPSSLAVIGPIANATNGLIGDYAGIPKTIVSVLAGLQVCAPSHVAGETVSDACPSCPTTHQAFAPSVTYAVGCEGVWCTSKESFSEAVSAAEKADVSVVVVGLSQLVETETHDRTFLTLPGYQDELVKAVTTAAHSHGHKVVVIVICGGPVSIPWILQNADAVVWAGYPGEQGGAAVANVRLHPHTPTHVFVQSCDSHRLSNWLACAGLVWEVRVDQP